MEPRSVFKYILYRIESRVFDQTKTGSLTPNLPMYFFPNIIRHIIHSLRLCSLLISHFFQGPALFAYNDAKFDRDDWKGIRMIHNSVKKKDPMRVGRFGLGFKSVFHMTGRGTYILDRCILEYGRKLLWKFIYLHAIAY